MSDDDDDGENMVLPFFVSIGVRGRLNNSNPSSPLSGAGRSGDNDIGDIGVSIFAPLSLLKKPNLAIPKELKNVIPYPKGTKGKKHTVGNFTRQLDKANNHIQEMAKYVIASSNLVKEYTKSVTGVVNMSHKQLVKTHASLIMSIEVNVKHVGSLSIKLDTAKWKVVSTKDHLKFELKKTKAMAVLRIASKQRTITELELLRTHYKKERDPVVEKLTKVLRLC